MNGWGCVPVKPHLWTLKLEFHIIFMGHQIFFSVEFFQSLRSIKPILGSRATEKQVAGQIWPAGRHLPSPALDQRHRGLWARASSTEA